LYYREGGPDGTQQTERFGFRSDGNSNNATSRQDFTLDLSTLGVSKLYVDAIQFSLQDMAVFPNSSSNGYALIYGLTLDDALIIAYPAAILGEDIISITAINTVANTMSVDGGSWLGADDSGDADGDTQVTAPAALSGTGTFDSFTGTTVDLASSNLDWIADNRLGETFYMKSDQLTTFMQDNPEHVAIFNAFKAAADQYPLDVNARRSSIVGAAQRLVNGESLDANEAAQLLLAVAKGVNAIEPFTYDGYYPLFYTAEKALAASSMNAYHTHQFDGTDYYMPDGGTLYHGTYVSPAQVEAQHFQANDETYSSSTGHTTSPSSNNSSSY
jgi:hypothetical protein